LIYSTQHRLHFEIWIKLQYVMLFKIVIYKLIYKLSGLYATIPIKYHKSGVWL